MQLTQIHGCVSSTSTQIGIAFTLFVANCEIIPPKYLMCTFLKQIPSTFKSSMRTLFQIAQRLLKFPIPNHLETETPSIYLFDF